MRAFSNCTALTDIYYSGTIEEWDNITKSNNWNVSTGDYTIHCTDGDIWKNKFPKYRGLYFVKKLHGISVQFFTCPVNLKLFFSPTLLLRQVFSCKAVHCCIEDLPSKSSFPMLWTVRSCVLCRLSVQDNPAWES